MKDPAASVIIVNWNGKRYLDKCLASVHNQTYPDFEVIVVDNGSVDSSVEFIESSFPQVQIIKNRMNFGFAKGNNIGIKAARGKYIATLNNDTVAEKDWLKNLICAAEKREDCAMFACKILSYDNRNLIESAGMLIYPDGIARCRGYLKEDKKHYEIEEDVLLPSACAALYRKEAIVTSGLFDEDYFAYCEDVDLGLRIRLMGLGCLYVPGARVYHRYSGTSRNNLLLKIYLAEKNRLWTAMKTFPLPQLIVSPIYTLARYLFYLYGAARKIEPAGEFCRKVPRIKVLLTLLRIYMVTLVNAIKILHKRHYVMSSKKVKAKRAASWLKKYRVGVRELTLYPRGPRAN